MIRQFTLFAFTLAAANGCQPDPGQCRVLTVAEIERAVRAALGPDEADASESLRIEILDYSRAPVAIGSVALTLPANSSSMNGVHVLHGTAGDTALRTPVWARARIQVLREVPFALTDLIAREPIETKAFEVRPAWVAWNDSPAADALNPTGARPRRTLRMGEAISPALVEFPFEVERGQTVELHVRAGAAHLRLAATALQSARRGQTVTLKLATRDAITGVVEGPGAVRLDAGATADKGGNKP